MQNDKLDNYLRTYRKKLGLTQREVSFLLGCHSGAKVSGYERFGTPPGASATIFAYEAIFQKPARELFAGIYRPRRTRNAPESPDSSSAA
jgi:transcriptional regulator with XRE-family HTH domain